MTKIQQRIRAWVFIDRHLIALRRRAVRPPFAKQPYVVSDFNRRLAQSGGACDAVQRLIVILAPMAMAPARESRRCSRAGASPGERLSAVSRSSNFQQDPRSAAPYPVVVFAGRFEAVYGAREFAALQLQERRRNAAFLQSGCAFTSRVSNCRLPSARPSFSDKSARFHNTPGISALAASTCS